MSVDAKGDSVKSSSRSWQEDQPSQNSIPSSIRQQIAVAEMDAALSFDLDSWAAPDMPEQLQSLLQTMQVSDQDLAILASHQLTSIHAFILHGTDAPADICDKIPKRYLRNEKYVHLLIKASLLSKYFQQVS